MALPLIELLLTFWPLLLLLYVPRLAQLIAVTVATRVRDTYDHAIPDEMPVTAGEWLKKRLRALGYGVDQVVTDKQADAYRPHDKVIQLREVTHFKADPVYWATAAHELGHARTRFERPMIGRLRSATAALARPLVGLGIALLLGHFLYHLPYVADIAFVCFAAALATTVFILVDEAYASILASRELCNVDHRRPIRAVLITSWLSYFATYAAYAIVLAQWSIVDTIVFPSAPAELTTFGIVIAVVLSLAVLLAIGTHVAELIRPDMLYGHVLFTLVRSVPIALFVLLVWNAQLDPIYAASVLVAIAASWTVWARLVHWPLALPWIAVTLLADRFGGPGTEMSPRYKRARDSAAGVRAIDAGNRRLEALGLWWRENPPLTYRLSALVKLGYLPLLMAFWFA